MNRILVAGSINMDVVATSERHPLPGETVPGNDLNFFPGGKGANQAVAAAKLDGDVLMIGKLGTDSFADPLEDFLKNQKVNTQYVHRVEDVATGTALIVVSASSENTIVVVPGANGLLEADDIEQVEMRNTDILVSQFEIPFETIKFFYEKGKSIGAKTILNPAPAKPNAEKLLELADFLIVNETELAFFLGENIIEESFIPKAAQKLQSNPSQTIVVTLGSSGVFALFQDKQIRIPGHKVKAADTTGAGDCFVGALACQLANEIELEAAITYANKAASICVQRPGAGPSMPTSQELYGVIGG